MPSKHGFVLWVGLMGLGAGALATGAARAQDAATPTTTAQAASSGGLEEVVPGPREALFQKSWSTCLVKPASSESLGTKVSTIAG